MLTPYFFIGFSIIFFGYIFQSSVLYYYFYVLRSNDRENWKTQPDQGKEYNEFFFWPLLESKSKKNQPKSYRILTSFNLLIASCVAGIVSDFYSQGKINMREDDTIWKLNIYNIDTDSNIILTLDSSISLLISSILSIFFSSYSSTNLYIPKNFQILNSIHFLGYNITSFINSLLNYNIISYNLIHFIYIYIYFIIIFIEFLIILHWQIILEYYWHILMHIPFFYKNFHKYHHHFKSPEIWDDLYIHPIEAFGYYLILNSPAFLFPCHLSSYLLYMILCGICGVVDHSGIKSLGTIDWIKKYNDIKKYNKYYNKNDNIFKNIFYILLYICNKFYNASDHDRHHSQWAVNFGFPFPFLDIYHNTFEGEYFNIYYKADKKKWGKLL